MSTVAAPRTQQPQPTPVQRRPRFNLSRALLAIADKLADFAVLGGLRDEWEALIVVAARYFAMAESEKWAGWFGEEGSGD